MPVITHLSLTMVLTIAWSLLGARSAIAEPAKAPAGRDSLQEARLDYARSMLLVVMPAPAPQWTIENYPRIRRALLTAGRSEGTRSSSSAGDEPDRGQYFNPAPLPDIAHPELVASDEGGWKADLAKHLLPGGRSLFWRSLNLSFSWLDQPDAVFVGVSDENPTGFVENPDLTLNKWDVKLSPGMWFRTSADFDAAYGIAKNPATQALVDLESDPLSDPAIAREMASKDLSKLTFLAWSKKSGLKKRFASAVTLSLSVSERSRFSGTQLISGETRDRDRNAFTFSFRFDPNKLITFPGELAAAYTALEAHTALKRENLSGLEAASCNGGADPIHPIECLRTLTGIKLHGRWLAGLLPTLEVKTVDQFDFVAVGGNFVTSPLIEKSLETFSVTWDLGAALDTAKHRREAVKAIALHHQLTKRDEIRRQELILEGPDEPVTLQEGELLYLSLNLRYSASIESPKATWKLSGDSNLKLSQDGILSGYPPLGEHMVAVEVQDTYLNKVEKTIDVVVRPDKAVDASSELAHLYQELFLEPRIVLDDMWYREFQDAWERFLSAPSHESSTLAMIER